jgi:hypothetical protein
VASALACTARLDSARSTVGGACEPVLDEVVLDVLVDIPEVHPAAVAALGPAQQQVEDAVRAAARVLPAGREARRRHREPPAPPVAGGGRVVPARAARAAIARAQPGARTGAGGPNDADPARPFGRSRCTGAGARTATTTERFDDSRSSRRTAGGASGECAGG